MSVKVRWILVIIGFLAVFGIRYALGEDAVEYRGERYKLRQWFAGYEEYSKFGDPLHPDERARVKQAMLAQPAPAFAPNIAELLENLPQPFPGYGGGASGVFRDAAGLGYSAQEVEIPGLDESRFMLYRINADSSWSLVADVVLPADVQRSRMVVTDSSFQSFRNGKLHREVRLKAPLQP